MKDTFLINPNAIINKDKVSYVIGVDTYDKKCLAYCLCRNINGQVDVILSKRMTNKKSFEEEVDNLSKYFNAVTYREDKSK